MTDIKDLSKKLREAMIRVWGCDMDEDLKLILDELDRLIEVEKVLKKQMTKGYPTGSEWIDIEKALKRADEIGKGKDGKA